MIDVFNAAGSTYSFNKKSAYSSSNYPAKLYNGSKKLPRNHRGSFPNPIDTNGLAGYLAEHIKKESVRTVMNYFTLSTDAEINIPALSRALADQFHLVIHEPDSDVGVVAANYQRYLTEPVEKGWTPYKPLYDGDSFWVETALAERSHSVDFYEKFTHTWKLLNSGKVKWTGRKLVCTNKEDITPYADMDSIDIPETPPNGRATISVRFDARGDEDTFVSTWIIVDDKGKDCFPAHTGALSVTVKVENKSFKRSGGK